MDSSNNSNNQYNQNPRRMSGYQKTLVTLAAILIIVGVYYAYTSTPTTTEVATNTTMPDMNMTGSSTMVMSTTTTTSTPSQPVAETYTNKAHLYEVAYTSDWEMTNIFSVGAYANAVAFVPVAVEPTLAAEIQPTSASITHAAADNAVFFRIVTNTSINSVVSSLYGNGVVVSNAVINGKNIAHVIHSKSSDPTNWQGGSTEAYIFRNTLGEAIVVEANYSTPEPASSGPLHSELEAMVTSLTLLAQ